MYKTKTVSIVFPAYNEEKYIAKAVKDFSFGGYADEIVVIDNNSNDKTAQLAKSAKARVVTEKRQGYGFALMRGLKEAKGDLVITAEPDGTFFGRDIEKLLSYSDDFDVVFGTRTFVPLIHKGAKMGRFLKWGNIFIAKLLHAFHGGPNLTDVGCTLKLIRKEKLMRIEGKLKTGKSHFSPEFMILCIRSGFKCIEIPVNYSERVGDSKITSNFSKSLRLGLRMIRLIVDYRLRGI